MGLQMKNSRGMTLVEVLISMVISLVVTLAAYQTFAASEGYRRAATAGGDATFSGSIGTYALQRDLRMAGFGINTASVLGCRVLAYDEGVSPARDFTFTLAPVVITQGAAGAPDTLEISYSSTDAVPIPVRLTQATPNPTTQYFIENGFGITAGQLLVLAEPGRDCSLQQATNTPSLMPAGQQDRLQHVDGMYTSPFGTPVASRYNKPGGLGPNYTLAGVVYSIGQAPTVNRYYLQNENLVVDPVLLGNVAQPVAAGIVQLQAQYGRDNNADGVIDVWSEVAPASPIEWAGMIAVRLALVARSAEGDRPDAGGICNATTVAPIWAGGNFDLSARADWRCFRYRVFESTISLRNMIWRPA
ncbi:MAG TPA: PilW family protein [Burkholderiaceae bacterium]|nr:PilW family protein [Burkholderiaceae bacterium]